MGTFTEKDKETLDKLHRKIASTWCRCDSTIMESRAGKEFLAWVSDSLGDIADIVFKVSRGE